MNSVGNEVATLMYAQHMAYIEQHFLKKGQTLSNIDPIEPNSPNSVEVFHTTKRYRKRVGRFDWVDSFAGSDSIENIRQLGKLFHSSRVSKSSGQIHSIGISEEGLESLFQQNVLMRKTDYDKDGRTALQVSYVAGLQLHRRIEEERQKIKATEATQLQEKIERLDKSLDQWFFTQPQHEARVRFIALVRRLQQELVLMQTVDQDEQEGTSDLILNSGWTLPRRMAYSDFLIAVAEVAATRPRFDWKEIGARYYREIGGSKRFDSYKEEFLFTLETQIDRPLELLGLVSTGSLYSVYFSGQLSGEQGLFYPTGYTHALTDLTTFLMTIKSDARFLWLVENRAVLTRMSAENNFLERTNSLVIGLDGQLRGAHKKLIRDLLHHSPNLAQIMIWCDYDKAGYDISNHLHRWLQEIMPEKDTQALPMNIRWVASDSATLSSLQAHDWDTYCQIASSYADSPAEQEIEMGGADDWMQWMNG